MSNFLNYIGLPYEAGKNDCFSIGRKFFKEEYGLSLRNYARPTNFWEDETLDLYQMYRLEGFRPVFDQPIELGDVLLMPYLTRIVTHACIVVGDNLILHHPPGGLSTTDRLRPRWLDRATVIIRHPKVSNQQVVKKVHLHDLIDNDLFRDPEFQKTVTRVLES